MRTVVKVLGFEDLNRFYDINFYDKSIQQYQQNALYRYVQFTIKY
jgi:hypothetical protein